MAILDLYPNTGECHTCQAKEIRLIPSAVTNLVTRRIFARTETGAPVTVMCDPSTVSRRYVFATVFKMTTMIC